MNPNLENNDGRPETGADLDDQLQRAGVKDCLLFEEAVFEILVEDFPGRLRSSLNEEETWKLHRAASSRVFAEKYDGL